MKDTRVFNINEIITIVMEEVSVEENNKMYGIDEERSYPKSIWDKLNDLEENDFEDFMGIIEKMAEEILNIKSEELNVLNKCHEEIIYLAQEYLEKYLEK